MEENSKKPDDSKYSEKYKEEFKFLFIHCIKREYFNYFRKLNRKECFFCTENPIKGMIS